MACGKFGKGRVFLSIPTAPDPVNRIEDLADEIERKEWFTAVEVDRQFLVRVLKRFPGAGDELVDTAQRGVEAQY